MQGTHGAPATHASNALACMQLAQAGCSVGQARGRHGAAPKLAPPLQRAEHTAHVMHRKRAADWATAPPAAAGGIVKVPLKSDRADHDARARDAGADDGSQVGQA